MVAMPPRRCPLCHTHGAACCTAKTDDQPVDVWQGEIITMGDTQRYDVSGRDNGSGGTFPADTLLNLDDNDAVRFGLIDPPKKKREPSENDDNAEDKARRVPGTRKRTAPNKSA